MFIFRCIMCLLLMCSAVTFPPGIMYAMGALGPAIGFLMSAAFLSTFVEPGKSPEGLSDDHNAWVGAWWVGLLVCSFLALVTGVPLLLFPKQLPGNFHSQGEDQNNKPMVMGFGRNLKGVLCAQCVSKQR